ncbi:BREX-1 system phosphatase PglZ type A [Burkholderia gladioli]|uniref:Alkaline phosphatase domain-containing protein n=1 Tax=Burkholderia gladioli (strain BSR3) TaxID=999541 RepID=F2LB30_BURGS|nr:BREX-1 system phosphatase PglZ type A [Burkholderia gladioli]AEA60099.1 alkaline phosphatase domain-containing protein [Burkholderia gladioli BSR3]
MTSAPHTFLPALSRLLAEGHSLVFWNDAEGEFASQLDGVELDGVRVVRLDQVPALQVKIWIEQEKDARWLFYAPFAEPEPAADWLLDARLRGKAFSADTASIQLDELGLTTQSLRAHLKHRAKFLRARERLERLKRWSDPQDTAEDLDRKMLAVVVRAETPDASAILLKVFAGLAMEADDLGATPKALADIATNDLDDAFWTLVEREMGYREAEPEARCLRGLLYAIFATDFCNGVRATPAPMAHLLIRERARAAHASVFANRWRKDMANYGSYDTLSKLVASDLRVDDLIRPMSAEGLVDAMTFERVEKRVIADLKGRIIAGGGANMDSIRALIGRRRDGHWANPLLAGANDSTRALAASYDALEAAAGFFELKAKRGAGFSFPDAPTAFAAYRSEIFQFDQLYRWFMRATESVEPMGWALLHELRDRMEGAYSGWFIPQLASAWASVIEGEGGLLSAWTLPGVVNQQAFYAQVVQPEFDSAKRVFVIISDAFRYEAAEELTRDLNTRNRVKARLDAMLGVLPSYTTLGMASLLPHERLAYKSNANLDVMVDAKPSATLEQRSAVLAQHEGVAIGRDELMEKGKERGREFVKPHRLVYIYHDRIDAIGDKRATETKAFEATAQTIKELADTVNFIVNSLNGSTVIVTADHGFLYQESALEEADRSVLDAEPEGAIKSKKRYILGRGMGSTPKAWCGSTERTAGTDAGEGSVDFWAPKAAGRFHFAGGARFVHGSAMPQEIAVPVIVVKESESEKVRSKSVEVSPLGSSNRVVTNKQRFEFIQNEAISERVLPVTLIFSIRDGDTPVSDEQAITFDSASPLLDERKRSVMLTIQAGSHDRTKDYFLVARDAKTKAEAWRQPVRIDLAFSNDF